MIRTQPCICDRKGLCIVALRVGVAVSKNVLRRRKRGSNGIVETGKNYRRLARQVVRRIDVKPCVVLVVSVHPQNKVK